MCVCAKLRIYKSTTTCLQKNYHKQTLEDAMLAVVTAFSLAITANLDAPADNKVHP